MGERVTVTDEQIERLRQVAAWERDHVGARYCEIRERAEWTIAALDELRELRTERAAHERTRERVRVLENAVRSTLDALYFNDDSERGMVGAWFHGKADTVELHRVLLAALAAPEAGGGE